MKIADILIGIRNSDLVLPEFQREYVWSREQAKQLMISLARKYPVGSLLLWKTDAPPELKNIDVLPEKIGTVQVILDGQQRLTTLHMMLTGDIPAYYTEAEIESDPRDLYYNLETDVFQYYQSSRMKDDPRWVRVVDCFSAKRVSVFDVATQCGYEGQDAFTFAETLNDNLNRLRAIGDVDLPEQVVPSAATLTDAINIFDRVNSQGTKLTDAELALTHITGHWPQARRVMKIKIDECADKSFWFTLTFMTRALTAVVTGRALFETIHRIERAQLEEGWKLTSKIIDYLMTILPQKAFIHSTEDLSTTNALIPLIAYLNVNDGRFPNETSVKHATNWLYAALTRARFTGQTDQRLEADVITVAKEQVPWPILNAHIEEQRGRIEVKASDFEGRGAQNPLYRTTFIIAKAHGAVDWFNGVPLGQTHGSYYSLQSHHIFPQSLLYKADWDVDNYMHRQVVNEIANRAFLTATTNLELSNTEPAKYLPGIEEKYPGALSSQFIPMDPVLWRLDRYPDFLAARREIIARKINEYMESLVVEPEETYHRPIIELVSLGESSVLEFKSTLQWDVVQNQANKGLRKSSLKTIAAFLNSEGGTLVIGVEDDGSIHGLQKDLSTTKNSLDKFEQLLAQLISDQLGVGLAHYYNIRFEEVDDERVCVIDVERANQPVFLKGDKGKEFFIRVCNTSRALDAEGTHQYIDEHWDV